MTDYKKATSAADMKANFPAKPAGIIGKPNLQELVCILSYIMMCAQTQKSTISPDLNLLYLAVPPEIYAQYTQQAYPHAHYPQPAPVDDVPNYSMAQDDNDRARISATHASDLKRREDVINMHNALADTFLDMMENTYRAAYDRNRLRQPNSIFRDVFHHFLQTYGRSTAEDRHMNKERMAADWQPIHGFEALIDRINSGIQFALFSSAPINENDIVDIAVRVLTRCGLYPEEMKAWHNRDGTPGDATEKTWFRFQLVWAKNIATCDDSTSTTAGQHGYGMNIGQVTDGTSDDASFDTSITNFSQAHQHTQAALSSLST